MLGQIHQQGDDIEQGNLGGSGHGVVLGEKVTGHAPVDVFAPLAQAILLEACRGSNSVLGQQTSP